MAASTSRVIQTGFLPFGSNDESVIFSASLKSASDLPSGAVFSGTGAGSQTYDATKGMNLGHIDNRMNYIAAFTTAQKTELMNGGHISFEVSKTFLDVDNIPATSRYILNLVFTTASTYDIIFAHSITTGRGIIISGATNTNTAINATGKDDQVKCVVSWSWGSVNLYIEGILAATVARTIITGKPLSAAYVGSRTSSFQAEIDGYIRNLQVSNRPVMLPVSQYINNMTGIGDSILVQGQYPSNYLGILGYTGTGYGDSSVEATTAKDDSGFLTTVHRKLALAGVHIGGKINSYGRVSTVVDSGGTRPLSQRTTAMTGTGEYPTPGQRNNLSHVISYVGTNDAAAGTLIATFHDDYQTEITAWIAAGATHIYLCEVIGRLDADYEAEIDAINAQIAILVAENPTTCYLVPLFDEMGGHSILPADLSGDSLHPSSQGQRKIGELVATVVLNNYK